MKRNCSVPAFLSKLWTLIEDQSTNDLIRWSQDGCSFLVLDDLRFSKEVLPLYFKHSNMTSFIRQLNMYGFHKVVHTDCGLPRDGDLARSVMFQHRYFQRSQAQLLSFIQRKVSVSRVAEDVGQASQVLVEVPHLQRWWDSSHLRLQDLCRDNENLWREMDSLRQKYQHQHQIIKKIIHFIASAVQSSTARGIKRKLSMIDRSGESCPAPKLRRSVSVQSSRNNTHMDSRDGVYSNRVVLSDLSHLLQAHCKHNSVSLHSTQMAAVFSEVPSGSSSASLHSTQMPPVFSEVPSGSTKAPSKSKLMSSVFTEVPSAHPAPPPQSTEVLSTFSEVPPLSSPVVSPSQDMSSIFFDIPCASTSLTSLCAEVPSVITEVPSEVTSIPSLWTEVPSTFTEVLSGSTCVPSLCAELPSVATGVLPLSSEIPSMEPEVPLGSNGVSSETSGLTSVDQALSLLMEPETQDLIENSAKRCENDPLALIDSSLAAICCSLAPSHGLDLLSEFFRPGKDASDHSVTGVQTAEGKSGAQPGEETPLHTQTVPEAVSMATLGVCGADAGEDDDVGEGSDILPSLLRLAQEASALSMPTSGPTP